MVPATHAGAARPTILPETTIGEVGLTGPAPDGLIEHLAQAIARLCGGALVDGPTPPRSGDP